MAALRWVRNERSPVRPVEKGGIPGRTAVSRRSRHGPGPRGPRHAGAEGGGSRFARLRRWGFRAESGRRAPARSEGFRRGTGEPRGFHTAKPPGFLPPEGRKSGLHVANTRVSSSRGKEVGSSRCEHPGFFLHGETSRVFTLQSRGFSSNGARGGRRPNILFGLEGSRAPRWP